MNSVRIVMKIWIFGVDEKNLKFRLKNKKIVN